MNLFEKILYILQVQIDEPKPFGVYHISCLIITAIIIYYLYKRKNDNSEKQLKLVLGTYGIIALILEIFKQLIWAFNYDAATNIVTWDYMWYAFPFQLCTTPMYVSLICLFLKEGKLRDCLFSYISFVTIIGSISVMLVPDQCLTEFLLVNIHTMWLHLGSFIVSIYLLISGIVKINKESLKKAILVFLVFVGIAEFLNILIYNINILNNESFNMFYISPYFISELPVFDIIQKNAPYIIFLMSYIIVFIFGACIIYFVSNMINNLHKKS